MIRLIRLSALSCESIVKMGEPELLQLHWYEATVRKLCHAEPMVLYSPVKAAAFDSGSSTLPTWPTVCMLVSVERHGWIDQQRCPHEWKGIGHSSDHVERLQRVESGVTESREAMAAVADALLARLRGYSRCLICIHLTIITSQALPQMWEPSEEARRATQSPLCKAT